MVDYGDLTKFNGSSLITVASAYVQSVKNVPRVGARIAEFISFLIQNNVLSLNLVHVVAVSMGCHVSGEVGNHIKKLYGGQPIARITGLDPAGPLFEGPISFRALEKWDAAFVDVIHTNLFGYGTTLVDGLANFYANGGITQPGCPDGPVGTCSHGYSVDLYAASITTPFIACSCLLPLFNWNPVTTSNCLSPCQNPTYVGPYCSSE
ncbi:Lipase member H [Folsomia candida]|uniref:Lipase member H n=2 Tax=Folsomia candida TaxID=158441 RepID=A0A226DJ67_FOLCA|nr:Lipase member H [Folsomia candida]